MANVSFQAPSEYQIEADDIARRRKYAEALQAQSMQPMETQMAGGWAIPNSPLQGFGRVAQAYAARRGQDRASEQLKALGERYNTERGTALAAALRAGTGTPAQTVQQAMPTDQEGTGAFDMAGTQGPATQPVEQPAVPGNRQAMISALMGSKFPDLQSAGMAQSLKDAEPYTLSAGAVRKVGGQTIAEAPHRPQAQPEIVTLQQSLANMLPSDPAYQQTTDRIKHLTNIPSESKGTWGEPYTLNGAVVQKNDVTGQVRQAVNREPQIHNYNPPAVTTAVVMDPNDPTRQLSVDARTYKGGSIGSPGVIGVSGKLGDAQKLVNKREFNMQGIGGTIQEARDLLTGTKGGVAGAGEKPTSSGVGAAVDFAGSLIGKSPAGAVPAAKLKAVGGALVSKMPRMEGPQSDKDVVLYKEMAGKVGDPTVPIDQRTAALDVVESLWAKYENLNPGTYADRRNGGGGPPPGAVQRITQ